MSLGTQSIDAGEREIQNGREGWRGGSVTPLFISDSRIGKERTTPEVVHEKPLVTLS